MTKPNGKGRGWRRKAWQDLAPATRKRYQQSGIDAAGHAKGYSPRQLSAWKKEQQQLYGKSLSDIEAEIASVDRAKLFDVIADQQRAQRYYLNGQTPPARQIWDSRDGTVIESMYWYHAVFSFKIADRWLF